MRKKCRAVGSILLLVLAASTLLCGCGKKPQFYSMLNAALVNEIDTSEIDINDAPDGMSQDLFDMYMDTVDASASYLKGELDARSAYAQIVPLYLDILYHPDVVNQTVDNLPPTSAIYEIMASLGTIIWGDINGAQKLQLHDSMAVSTSLIMSVFS